MKKRSKIAAGAGAALAVVGAGGAVAADRLTPKAESQAIVNDAAKQLGVDPTKLSDALEQALKNRIDTAVKDGRLTKEQESMIEAKLKQHIADFVEHGFRSFGHDNDGDSFHSNQSSGPTPSSTPWALS